MPSPGTAADISAQDANDLLQKLITESANVQAVFWGRGDVSVTVRGFASRPVDGVVQITEGKGLDSASLSFGLRDVIKFKYADNRAFPSADVPGVPRRLSALIFVYPDDTQVALFELADTP
jgi:hypothetical protein